MRRPSRSLDYLKLQQSPSNLKAYSFELFPNFERHVFLSHQSPEFGVVIKNIKFVVLTPDVCMLPGDWYVGDSDFALVAPPQLYPSFWSVLDYHNAFLLLAGSLKDEIRSLRSVQSDQFLTVHLSFMGLHLDKPRKFAFTDLTFKFCKVVVLSSSNNILFYLNPDPLSQAGIVYCSARTVAFARVE